MPNSVVVFLFNEKVKMFCGASWSKPTEKKREKVKKGEKKKKRKEGKSKVTLF